jgi:hypothetical protein
MNNVRPVVYGYLRVEEPDENEITGLREELAWCCEVRR